MNEQNNRQSDQIKLSVLGEYHIVNFKNPVLQAVVVPLSEMNLPTEENIREIVEICNQEDMQKLIFREKMNGAKYDEAEGKRFVAWANTGWKEGSYFVYAIKTIDGKVIGTIDLKSTNPDSTEVGYWMSSGYPGYMTNAVIGLAEQAKKAGYRTLVAYTKTENDKSKGVLIRAGFQYVGQEEKKPGVVRDKFVLSM